MVYYISVNQEQKGPWSFEEVLMRLQNGEVKWTDVVFDEAKNEWVALSSHKAFEKEAMKSPTSDGKSVVLPLNNEKEWYVLKGENKYGPYAYLELVKMLQRKSVYEYDFIWNSQMTGWKRFAELPEFSVEKIREIKDLGVEEVGEVFFRRRHARAAYGASILVHDSKRVWRGQGLELSPGGAGIVIDSSDFEPGQNLFLHFKAGDGVPPFNALCTVVSKQYVSDHKSPVKYGVKFINISQSIQLAIKNFTTVKAA